MENIVGHPEHTKTLFQCETQQGKHEAGLFNHLGCLDARFNCKTDGVLASTLPPEVHYHLQKSSNLNCDCVETTNKLQMSVQLCNVQISVTC